MANLPCKRRPKNYRHMDCMVSIYDNVLAKHMINLQGITLYILILTHSPIPLLTSGSNNLAH